MRKNIIATKEQLFDFLYKNVWEKNLILEYKLDVEEKIKYRLITNTNKSMERAKKCRTAKDIVNYFFNALSSEWGKERYLRLKRYNLLSFEDVKEEFEKLCYGKGE